MHISGIFVALLAASASAHDPNPVRVPKGYMRRREPLANTTSITNPTSIPATTLALSTSTISAEVPNSSPRLKPSASQLSTPANTSSPFPSQITSEQPACSGIATYTDSVPPTVFVTIDEPFEVTVTVNASSSSTASETLITPPPECGHTIVPITQTPVNGPIAPENSVLASTSTDKLRTGFGPDAQPGPSLVSPRPSDKSGGVKSNAPLATEPPQTTALLSASNVYSSVPYTSTVTVTRKTPVTVTAPPTTSADVNFNPNSIDPATTSPSSPPSGGKGGNGPSSGGSTGASPPNNGVAGPLTTTSGAANGPTRGGPGQTVSTGSQESTSRNVGDIFVSIVSVIRSSDPNPPAPPSGTTLVAGVPVVVLPSSVVIGGSTIAIPTATSTSIQVNGVTFGIGPSQVVAPSATITIGAFQSAREGTVITPQPSSTVITAGGLTITVASTVAIVSGTTYRIGQGARTTSVTVGGNTVSIGPSGIGLPQGGASQTTTSPSGGGYVVYTVSGNTLSIDNSEAVISGTTYRIGPNAPQWTTVIGGQTVSFGPSGVGFASTTIAPTSPPSSTAETGSRVTTTGAAGTQSPSSENAGSQLTNIPFSEVLGWYLILMIYLGYQYPVL